MKKENIYVYIFSGLLFLILNPRLEPERKTTITEKS